MLAIRIDSIDIDDSSIHYFPRYTRGDEDTQGLVCAGASWMGDKWIQHNLGEYFFNAEEDSIRFQPLANLGESWNCFDLPNGFLEAEVTDVSLELVLENLDLIKTIRLNAKDDQGNPIEHPMNDQTILISENYGFVKTFDFYHFPNDLSPKELIGLTKPDIGQSLLAPNELFNWDIGLERHFYQECSNNFTFSYSRTSRRLIILDSTHIDNTITYVIDRTRYSESGDPMYNQFDTTYVHDTIEVNQLIDLGVLTPQPFEWFPDIEPSLFASAYLFIFLENGRWKKVLRADLKHEDGQDCMNAIFDNESEIIFQSCLGQTNTANYSFGGCEEDLVYFQKGTEIWGTPIDFDILNSTETILDFQSDFQVFPNPFTDQFKIHSLSGQDGITKWEVFDLYGKSIIQQEINASPQVSIALPDLPSGMYLLKWADEQKRQFLTKLVKK